MKKKKKKMTIKKKNEGEEGGKEEEKKTRIATQNLDLTVYLRLLKQPLYLS